jgi:hypothetical protein
MKKAILVALLIILGLTLFRILLSNLGLFLILVLIGIIIFK